MQSDIKVAKTRGGGAHFIQANADYKDKQQCSFSMLEIADEEQRSCKCWLFPSPQVIQPEIDAVCCQVVGGQHLTWLFPS